MKYIYDKRTFDTILSIEDDAGNVGIGPDHGLFIGIEQEFNNYIRVKKDQRFGDDIVDKFLTYNKGMDISVGESVQLLQTLQAIAQLLKFGDITSAHALTIGVETDPLLFTEQRKSELLTMMAKHLGYI